jgi:large subunit ribosomal protein L13
MILRGKYKPSYTPHVDCGDNVIVINSEKSTLQVKWTKDLHPSLGYPGRSKNFKLQSIAKKKSCISSRVKKGIAT